ncbi:hypothetical protein [Streptomyces sp. NPDC058861]|uniref:hypothetical protein n=1 Tax=Streptomyces sp. NPDC058861 TaxID=3346653 RepID=UPI0036C41210
MLLAAWETAAELLPGVVGDPAGLPRAAPPATELRIACDGPSTTTSYRSWTRSSTWLHSVRTNGPGSRPIVAITAAPAMDRAQRQRLLRDALVHMAHAYGYVDAGGGVL